MRRFIIGASLTTLTCLGTPALAQQFAEKGAMALSADHLFGVTSYKITLDPDIPYTDDIDVKGTVFSLLWGAQAGASPVVPAIYPRTSFDYFVIDGLSLGGSVGFSTASVKVKSGGSSMEGDHTAVTFAPRVGYAFGLSDTIWFWLRGGPTYVSIEADPEYSDVSEASALQFKAEGMFVFGISGGFGLEVGPALGLPLTGEFDAGRVDGDLSALHFGVYAGMVGWF
ncbi:MAG TPA: hypothetical protein PK710_24820 [Polyangiaceae bacterium]|nr:hypothetical protein [Polyangiaceae bacterium]